MVILIKYASIHLSLEAVAVFAGHVVLMEDDLYFADFWQSMMDF
jgi:hypothetical protein